METDPITDITTPGSNPRAERNTLLYTLGFDLTFQASRSPEPRP